MGKTDTRTTLSEGDVLAGPVKDAQGRTLVDGGVAVTAPLIKVLERRGVTEVEVVDMRGLKRVLRVDSKTSGRQSGADGARSSSSRDTGTGMATSGLLRIRLEEAQQHLDQAFSRHGANPLMTALYSAVSEHLAAKVYAQIAALDRKAD